mmetsp:Transcript_3827/g.10347  ORF Transcript_3827/g.10347 Transcript_3827/m.10347 type:complete len:83 (-) Transcript_3827:1070-1318(-)|eukprot:1159767-Pelagomonas_calceolata.AAC.1
MAVVAMSTVTLPAAAAPPYVPTPAVIMVRMPLMPMCPAVIIIMTGSFRAPVVAPVFPAVIKAPVIMQGPSGIWPGIPAILIP